MPIRIYALAKELKIDSKDLVDVCTKLGITGKGSALASLTDEEVTKVMAHLQGPPRGAPQPPPPPPPPQPAAAPPPVAEPGPLPVSAQTTAAVAPAPVSPVRPKPSPDAPITRDQYIAPGGTGGKPPLIRPSVKPRIDDKEKRADKEPRSPAKREPVIKLAAIPKQNLPAPKAKEAEQTQKPIMTLPPDAIRGAKAGGRAPLEQFTKQQDKKRSEREQLEKDDRGGKDKPRDKRGATPAVVPPLDAGGKVREKVKPKKGEDEEDEKRLAAMASARAARQQTRRRVHKVAVDEDDEQQQSRAARRQKLQRRGASTAAPRKGNVVVQLPCTVRSFSEATGVPNSSIQRALMTMGTMATINAEIDQETAELIAAELGLELEFRLPESLEDALLSSFADMQDDPSQLKSRPPIVTFLGHVDHGKTSLLDRIININVVSGEAGGITQHIRAYKVAKGEREIAFVDTPGHEAFTEMRARGANVTDIAVLVVAADDGVMLQTAEAISHARAAGVPIIVALNKVDLPSADINRAMQSLSAHQLLPTEWGGDVEVVKTSATTGEGIDDLLETILLTAEIHEYKANPSRPASGTCLEAEQEGNRGVVAKTIVRNGTLRVGDVVVCGSAYGRVKAMYDTLNGHHRIDEAGPSTPVNLTGLNVAPQAGDLLFVMDDIAKARQIAEAREHQMRSQSLSGKVVRVSFEEFQRRLSEGSLDGSREAVNLNLILRADVRGSIEAIQKELSKLDHPEVRINILQATVGGVTSADVTLADASDAVIIGFNVIPDEAARSLAEDRGVEIRRYNIIYKVSEDLKAMLEGKLKPEERVADLGRALVQRLFTVSRIGTIAGCRVLAGKIERGCRVRVNRDGRGIGDYALDSLRREKDDVREVREGFECGMKLAGFNDLKEGDILEAYKIEEHKRTL